MSKEMWNQNFSNAEYVYGEQPNEFIHNHSCVIPSSSSIACFAEGEGRNAVFLAEKGHVVTTYDQSAAGLEKTKALACKKGTSVNTVETDLTVDLHVHEAFDAAVMVFGHVSRADQPQFINNMLQSLKPGGLIMLEVYSVEQLQYKTGGPPSENLLYTPEDVLHWLKDHKVLHFYYGEAFRKEGTKHTGTGHVIQAIAKKAESF